LEKCYTNEKKTKTKKNAKNTVYLHASVQKVGREAHVQHGHLQFSLLVHGPVLRLVGGSFLPHVFHDQYQEVSLWVCMGFVLAEDARHFRHLLDLLHGRPAAQSVDVAHLLLGGYIGHVGVHFQGRVFCVGHVDVAGVLDGHVEYLHGEGGAVAYHCLPVHVCVWILRSAVRSLHFIGFRETKTKHLKNKKKEKKSEK
jgi:hypothetical protein